MAEFPNAYTFDMQPYVNELVKRVRDVADEQIRSVLEQAFEAGYDKGFRSGAHGPDEFGHFEEWVEDFIETHRQD